MCVPTMELPASVGKYELLELLEVDSAEVYRGRDTETGRPVVLKILAAGTPSDVGPGVVDHGELSGRPYVVVECLPSEDLREAVRNGRSGSLDQRLKIALQIAQAFDSGQGPAGNAVPPEMDVYVFGTLLIELLEEEDVPSAVRGLAMRCTEAQASERPREFGEIIEALKAALGSPARVPVSPARALIRLSIIVYAAVLVVTALAVATWLRVQPPTQVEGMIYIPAGTFLAGSDKHAVTLKAFYIDATEVTNAEYARFCRATGCAPPAAAPRLPVVNVNVAAARAYAQWAHKRLPSPLEWERAARGVHGALFPWGDAEDPSLANVSNNPTLSEHVLMPARSFAAYPALQMAGNAWEMVEDGSLRGGSYMGPLTPGILYDSVAIPEGYTAPDIGFRCVKDP